jgi:RNA polymerase-associated protein
LASLAPIFAGKSFFLSDEFTLVDCCMAPLLWRLHRLDIKLAPMPHAIKEYEERLFTRPSFKATLNEIEFGVKI